MSSMLSKPHWNSFEAERPKRGCPLLPYKVKCVEKDYKNHSHNVYCSVAGLSHVFSRTGHREQWSTRCAFRLMAPLSMRLSCCVPVALWSSYTTTKTLPGSNSLLCVQWIAAHFVGTWPKKKLKLYLGKLSNRAH